MAVKDITGMIIAVLQGIRFFLSLIRDELLIMGVVKLGFYGLSFSRPTRLNRQEENALCLALGFLVFLVQHVFG